MTYIKTYQLKDSNSTKSAKRFDVNGKSKTIVFESKRRDGVLLYSTSDSKIQESLENSDYFDNDIITIVVQKEIQGIGKGSQTKSAKRKIGKDPVSDPDVDDENTGVNEDDEGKGVVQYTDVTSFKQAKEVMERNYDIKKTSPSINTPDKIFAKAAELGISFPNLTVE